VLVWVLVVM